MSFLYNVSLMGLNRLANAILAFVNSALSARILSPGELGSVVVVVACVPLLMRMASFGLGQSAQFYGARESTDHHFFGYALLVSVVPVVAFSLVFLFIAGPLIGKLLLGGDLTAQELYKTLQYGIPLSLIHFVASLYTLGRCAMRRYFWISLLPVLASVLVLGWGFLGNHGLYSVMFAWLAQYCLSFVLGVYAFFARDNQTSAIVVPALMSIYRYALRSYAVFIAAFALSHISLIMGVWFTSSFEVGIFAVGRNFADALLLIYGAIGPLVFSYVGKICTTEARQVFIGRVCRLSFLLFSFVSVCIAIVAPFGIELIFGEQYSNSYKVVWLLLPGLVFSALQRILENYLYGRSCQTPLVFVHATSIALLVGSGFLLAPKYGSIGLASAGTVSFIGSCIFTMLIAYRTDGLNPLTMILPDVDDFKFLANRYFR